MVTKTTKELLAIFLVQLLLAATPSFAAKEAGLFDDVTEDSLDGSEVIAPQEYGFAAIPLIITNPSIGNGLGAAGLYIHAQSKENSNNTQRNMTGVFGFYTDEDSWMAGAMHSGSYRGDNFRIKALGGYAKLKMKFYGSGSDPIFSENPIGYSLESFVGLVRPSWRVRSTNWFVGPQYLGMFSNFKTSGDLGIPAISDDFNNAGWGVTATHDTTNSNIDPTSGGVAMFIGNWFGRWAGGDFNYGALDGRYRHYFPISETSVIAARTKLKYTGDNAPFFALSTLSLRGFDKNRYIDNIAIDAEAEYRFRFKKSFAVIGFAGLGSVASDLKDFGDARLIWSLGGGFRYFAKKSQGMPMGIDVAVSNDDWAWYFTMGESFQ